MLVCVQRAILLHQHGWIAPTSSPGIASRSHSTYCASSTQVQQFQPYLFSRALYVKMLRLAEIGGIPGPIAVSTRDAGRQPLEGLWRHPQGA